MNEYTEYRIPMAFENLPPILILEHEGRYYSFMVHAVQLRVFGMK